MNEESDSSKPSTYLRRITFDPNLYLDLIKRYFPRFYHSVLYDKTLEGQAQYLIMDLKSGFYSIKEGVNFFVLHQLDAYSDLTENPFAHQLFNYPAVSYCIANFEDFIIFFVNGSKCPLSPIYFVNVLRKLNKLHPLIYSKELQGMALSYAVALNDQFHNNDSKALVMGITPRSRPIDNLCQFLNLYKNIITSQNSMNFFGMDQFGCSFVFILDQRPLKYTRAFNEYLNFFKQFNPQIEYEPLLERYAEDYWQQPKNNKFNVPLLVDYFVCQRSNDLQSAILNEVAGKVLLRNMSRYRSFAVVHFKQTIAFAFYRSTNGYSFDYFFQNYRHATRGTYLVNDENLNVTALSVAADLSRGKPITEDIVYIYSKTHIKPKDFVDERRIYGKLINEEDNFKTCMQYEKFGFARVGEYFVIVFKCSSSEEKEIAVLTENDCGDNEIPDSGELANLSDRTPENVEPANPQESSKVAPVKVPPPVAPKPTAGSIKIPAGSIKIPPPVAPKPTPPVAPKPTAGSIKIPPPIKTKSLFTMKRLQVLLVELSSTENENKTISMLNPKIFENEENKAPQADDEKDHAQEETLLLSVEHNDYGQDNQDANTFPFGNSDGYSFDPYGDENKFPPPPDSSNNENSNADEDLPPPPDSSNNENSNADEDLPPSFIPPPPPTHHSSNNENSNADEDLPPPPAQQSKKIPPKIPTRGSSLPQTGDSINPTREGQNSPQPKKKPPPTPPRGSSLAPQ